MMNKKSDKKPNKRREQRPEKEYDQKMVDLARVTRVMGGGKRMSFRATIVIGNKNGKVGHGTAKGPDVQIAISKAVRVAEKNMIQVPITETGSIPHDARVRFKSADVLLKPAPAGTGVKAGGATRVVLDLAGVKNIVSKQLGSKNKINNVKAVYAALKELQRK